MSGFESFDYEHIGWLTSYYKAVFVACFEREYILKSEKFGSGLTQIHYRTLVDDAKFDHNLNYFSTTNLMNKMSTAESHNLVQKFSFHIV